MKVRRGLSKGKPREPVLRKSELLNVHFKKEMQTIDLYTGIQTLLKVASIPYLLDHLHTILGYIGYLNATYWA